MKVDKRTSSGVRHPMRYKLIADHDFRERAEAIADTYMDTIVESIVNQPRSQQKRIGPSEMGVECRRSILHKLNGDQEPPRGDTPWKPTIGTAVHDYLDHAFTNASLPGSLEPGRWLTENKVMVGKIGPTEITGSTDLYDTFGRAVLDHKIVGKYTLKNTQAHGPSLQYLRQANTYGKGWEDKGYGVDLVAICYLPREGELTDTLIWTAPYDRQIAVDTIARCDALWSLLQAVGIDQALALYPECEERFCKWCGSGNSFGKRPLANTTAELFGLGH